MRSEILAMRVTESARGSSGFIEDIVNKVRRGEEIVNMTNAVFSEVAAGSDKVVSLMCEISSASQEQSQGIAQVNSAIAEINMSAQQNAGNAERLSSAMSIFKADIQAHEDEESLHPARKQALIGHEELTKKLTTVQLI